MESAIATIERLDNCITTLSKSRLETLKELILGIISAGSVNLKEVCSRFSRGGGDSNYRKVQYFFKEARLKDADVIRYILCHLFLPEEELILAIDRTDWAFGQTRHNLLCISVLYKNTAVPLMVFPLERKGNSNTKIRCEILNKILEVIPCYRIKALLGDREFIGEDWFEALKQRHVSFVMRVRGNMTIGVGDYVGQIEQFDVPDSAKEHGLVHIGKDRFDLSTVKSGGELVAVVSYDVEKPLDLYKQRWGIETGFKCLKTNGFNMEKTHLKHSERIKMLIQICAMAMTVSFGSVKGNDIKIVKKNMDTIASPFLPMPDVSS